MPIGAATYPQGEKFSLVRSFIKAFAIADFWTIASSPGPNLTLINPANPAFVFHVNMDVRWWVWSSNFYTLDFIITDSYYVDPASGILTPMPFTLVYSPATPSSPSCTEFRAFGGVFPKQYITLLPATEPYWLPLL